MSEEKKPTPTKVPDGHARFVTTRQLPPNEKGFVGYETVWEPEGSGIQDAEEAVAVPKRRVDDAEGARPPHHRLMR